MAFIRYLLSVERIVIRWNVGCGEWRNGSWYGSDGSKLSASWLEKVVSFEGPFILGSISIEIETPFFDYKALEARIHESCEAHVENKRSKLPTIPGLYKINVGFFNQQLVEWGHVTGIAGNTWKILNYNAQVLSVVKNWQGPFTCSSPIIKINNEPSIDGWYLVKLINQKYYVWKWDHRWISPICNLDVVSYCRLACRGSCTQIPILNNADVTPKQHGIYYVGSELQWVVYQDIWLDLNSVPLTDEIISKFKYFEGPWQKGEWVTC